MLAVEFGPGLAGRLTLFDDTEIVRVLAAKLLRRLLMQFGEGAPRGSATRAWCQIEPFEHQSVCADGNDFRTETRKGLIKRC